MPLHKRVWWRVGGPADLYAEIGDLAQLAAARRWAVDRDIPWFLLGNGSNLLVADAGIRGLVVRLVGALADATADATHVEAGAGCRNAVLLARAERNGWTGLDAFAGIPGTVGGAVRMNAGSLLGETGDTLVDVDVLLPDGTVKTLSKSALALGYRHCVLPAGATVVRARFQQTAEEPGVVSARIRAFLERRKATQPLDLPSCGSTFRNPPGDAAGRLIEAAGLKGFRLGGAEVSQKHANFIVNHGDATANDIDAVIRHVQRSVQATHGIALVPEVERVGEWPSMP
ncbi:MAG: UDP-N-acetylmuramate dehydrogenase [Pseudomonadota bacterium]